MKLLPMRYDRLVRKRLLQGDLEGALLINSELCFSRGTLARSLHWRGRVILSGVIAAYLGDMQRAAAWLSAGIGLSRQKVVSCCSTFGFAPDFITWIREQQASLTSPQYWMQLFLQCEGEEEREKLLIRASTIAYAMGFENEVVCLLPRLQSNALDDWKAILRARLRGGRPRPDPLFTGAALWSGSFAHPGEKIARNIIVRAFTPSEGELFTEDEHRWLAQNDADFPAYQPYLKTAVRAIAAIALRDEAAPNLADAIMRHQDMLNRLDRREGPVKVFIGGFGWSGSSAVFDTLRGYEGVEEMPGAGEVPFINDGADSEPMLHQGPAGLSALCSDCIRSGGVKLSTWRQFLRLYVLLAGHTNYFEYKTVHANRLLLRRLGPEVYYALLLAFLREYGEANEAVVNKKGEQRLGAAIRFSDRLIKALFPDDRTVVLFNNAINTDKIGVLKYVSGRAVYISVNRTILDQMADQRRSNIFFNASAPTFAYTKRKKLQKFLTERSAVDRRADVRFHDLNFEDWVKNTEIRREISTALFGRFDADQERRHFNPSISVRNVAIYPKYLSKFEVLILASAGILFRGV